MHGVPTGRHQSYYTALVLDAVGANQARVIDHAGVDVPRRGSGEQDAPPGGVQLAAVGHGRVIAGKPGGEALVHLEEHEAIAAEVEGRSAAGGEVDGAQVRHDHAGIAHGATGQHDETTGGSGNHPLVFYGSAIQSLCGRQPDRPAVHELSRVHIQ